MMTEDQKRLRDALWNVSFVPGTGAKRIVHSVGDEISPRMEACLWRIAYTFRKQLPEDIATEAVRRKVDHRITKQDKYGFGICEICGRQIAKRSASSPCPGPPDPKPPKKDRKKKHGCDKLGPNGRCSTCSALYVHERLCPECGQPMLPPGVEKRENEYDHAQGCPLDPQAKTNVAQEELF